MPEPTDVGEPRAEKARVALWNLNRQDRRGLVSELVRDSDLSIIVLAESGVVGAATLEHLKHAVDRAFVQPASVVNRMEIYVRNPTMALHEVYADASKRLSIRVLRLGGMELLFVTAHLHSRMHWERADQSAELQVLSDQIRKEEHRRGHSRTFVVGDLNVNPFADGVVSAAGLHAMTTKSVTLSGSRTVQGREHPFFYNPMWRFFGDGTDGPPGTYYYRHSGHVSYEWNVLDQVLIRPDALPWFHDDVEIVTKIGETKLSDRNGRPRADVGSDHFPIVFTIVAPS